MYRADEARYDKMSYKRCGNSGILLPRVSLGMWQNFGAEKPLSEQKEIIFKAFDLGITHFDLETITVRRISEWQRKILERSFWRI